MLKFNNYPPTTPQDVEITPAAREAINSADPWQLHSYGEAIGYTILSAVTDGKIAEIARPLLEGNHELTAGFLTALTRVEAMREQGVANV